VRRCANTRIVSAEKLMYICKNQLGEFDPTCTLLEKCRSHLVPDTETQARTSGHWQNLRLSVVVCDRDIAEHGTVHDLSNMYYVPPQIG
jgi:hypothetical protein